MIKIKIINQIQKHIHNYQYLNVAKSHHITFITKSNKIIAIGYNSKKTSTFAQKLGYDFPTTHSELSAIKKIRDKSRLYKYTLINIRLNKNRQLCMSRPCKYCRDMLIRLGLKKWYYTDDQGKWATDEV